MIDLLGKLIIKDDYKNYNNAKVREEYGKIAGMVGIISNLLLFTAKLIVGILSRSIAIMVDAINNLTDSASSIITLFGFKLSGKPADEEHPYGHARTEYVASLFVSIIVLFVGFEFLGSSIKKIITPETTSFSLVMLIVLILSLAVKLWQGLFNLRLSKKINSQTLKATSTDSFNDIIITTAVIISATVEWTTGYQIDGYAGAVIAVYIIYSGLQLVKGTVDQLIGMAPSPELIDHIDEKLTSAKEIEGYHDLMVHDYGPGNKYGSVHVEIPSDADFISTHEATDIIERELEEEYGLNFVIHLDPVDEDEDVKRAEELISDLIKEVNENLELYEVKKLKTTSTPSYIAKIKLDRKKDKKGNIYYYKNQIDKRLHKAAPEYIFSIDICYI